MTLIQKVLLADYIHTYERSVSFDVSIEAYNVSLGIGYHKSIQEAYESITTYGMALGETKLDKSCCNIQL